MATVHFRRLLFRRLLVSLASSIIFLGHFLVGPQALQSFYSEKLLLAQPERENHLRAVAVFSIKAIALFLIQSYVHLTLSCQQQTRIVGLPSTSLVLLPSHLP